MEEWLSVASEYSVMLIDAMALVVILYGALEAFLSGAWSHFASVTGDIFIASKNLVLRRVRPQVSKWMINY